MSTTAPDDRISEYNPLSPTTEFAASFPVFDDDDLRVFVNGLERTDFTVSAVYAEGISNDAKAVFAVGVVGKVLVVGARRPHRSNWFSNGGPLPIRDLNLALDTVQSEVQEAARDIGLALKVAFGEEPLSLGAINQGNFLMLAEDNKVIGAVPDGSGNMQREIYDKTGKAKDIYEAIDEGLQLVVSKSGDNMTGPLGIHRNSDDTAGATIALGKARSNSRPLSGDTIGSYSARSVRGSDGVFNTHAVIKIVATEDHTDGSRGMETIISYTPIGQAVARDAIEIDDDGIKGRAGGSYEHLIVTPIGHGASPAAAAAANDLVFAAMVSKLGNRKIDLMGETWPVTVVPTDKAVNGFWRVPNFDAGATIDLPAFDTMDWYQVELDGGSITVSWPQDTFSSYNGVPLLGYMAAVGHDPGTRDWTVATSKDQCKNFTRFETGTSFDYGASPEVEVWSAAIIPPSPTLTPYVGAYHAAVAQNGQKGEAGALINLFVRALAKYDESGAGGGTVVNEGSWQRVLFGGVTMGEALRTAMNAAYSITTTGIPTLVHSMSVNGATGGSGGGLFFGFHGLDPAAGPHIGYISNDPRDLASNIGTVGRIAGLTEGVEPTVAWSHVNSGSRLCGFIRTQGSAYPIRFWEANGISQAAIETAVYWSHPAGGEFGTLSPIPCRMRPRRKGATSGWVPTTETLDGNDSDELHFAFTGRRPRSDGKPGKVGLYWGRVTRSGGVWGNIWSRAKIVKIADLYFARGNATANSNQVGVSSMTFSDANTLHIAASTESPGIKQDFDGQAHLNVYTIKLHDTYADPSERELYDTGLTRPTMVQRVPEYQAY